MKMLIVAATTLELKEFIPHFNLVEQPFTQTEKFDLLITGVGMTATAFALGKYLRDDHQLILNVGIAGSFDRDLKLGDLVQISEDFFAELGAEDHEKFLSIDDLGFGQQAYPATAEVKLLPKVKGITVNTVHGKESSIAKLKGRLDVQTESMEGAAVFYAAAQQSIPSLQIRSISNYVEPRNKDNWKIGLAIKNLNKWLINYVTQSE